LFKLERLWRINHIGLKTATGTTIDHSNLGSRTFFIPLERQKSSSN
jgi:hypothetical protein